MADRKKTYFRPYDNRGHTRLSQGLMLSWIVALSLALPPSLFAAPLSTAREYQVKAAFVYNFTQYFQWPAELMPAEDARFNICVFGENPFDVVLEVAVEPETVQGRPIKVLYPKTVQELGVCQLLFISSSATRQLASILNHVASHAILTVSDIPEFIELGGMVKLFERDNKIRIAIHLDRVRKNKLQADANLLRIADVIKAE